MAESVYVPSRLGEGYFSDVPAPVAGDDGKAVVYNHATLSYVYATMSGGGVTDHGALTGLADNDHPQYLLAAGVSAYGATLIDDADAATARGTLGLVIGTNVQAYNANLAALAGLTGAADRLGYFTGAGAMTLATFTAKGREVAAAADAAAIRTAAGLGTIATAASGDYAALATVNTFSLAQTLTGGAITNKISVPSNITNAFGLYRTNGTTQDYSYDAVSGNHGFGQLAAAGVKVSIAANSAQPALFLAGATGGYKSMEWTGDNSVTLGSVTTVSGRLWIGHSNGTGGTNGHIVIGSTGLVGINAQIPVTRLDVEDTNAATNAIQNAITMRSINAGTPAAGFGVGLRAGLKSSTTADQDAGRIAVRWNDATHASRQADMVFSAWYTSTEREFMRGRAGSAAPMIGFLGATPIIKPTITGSRGGNAALADLLTQMANYGLIVDGTTA